MRGRGGSAALVAALLLAAGCVEAARLAAPGVRTRGTTTLGPIRVSGESPFHCPGPDTVAADSEVEPSLAIDPDAPDRLLATWQQDRNAVGAALGVLAATTRDGGRSWRTVVPPGLNGCAGGPYDLASDPVVSAGPDRQYLAALAVRTLEAGQDDRTTEVVVGASGDGGRTWGGPVVVAPGGDRRFFLDKETILADPDRAGTAYVAWQRYDVDPDGGTAGSGAFVARTMDGGRTWASPVEVHSVGTETQFQQLVALPDGALLDLFIEAPRLSLRPERPIRARIAAVRSTDGGRTWSEPVTAVRYPFTAARDPGGRDRVRASGITISAAGGPEGTAYVAWSEFEPAAPRLRMARSDDGGRTWSAPVTVNAGSQAMVPTLAVDGEGRVGVLWYDDRPARSTGPFSVEVRLGWSEDDGRTWRQRRVDGPFDLRSADLSRDGLFVGDYEGFVGLPSGFAALYAQARPESRDGPTDLFFFAVRMPPR